MYENITEILIENRCRLAYTTGRAAADTFARFERDHESFKGSVSLNEKIAFELALTGSWSAKKTACIFTSEGLYEAMDPLMSSAYTGVVGGMLIVAVKDTGEDILPLGLFSKLPIIVSENAADFARSVTWGYDLSVRYQIPVLLQVRADIEREKTGPAHGGSAEVSVSQFQKDPGRWAATPRFRYQLHCELNEKLEKIRNDFEAYEGNRVIMNGKTGVITTSADRLEFFDEDVSLLHLATVHPLPLSMIRRFADSMDHTFILEGEHPVIKMQFGFHPKTTYEQMAKPPVRKKHDETMYGFTVVRDWLGPASAIDIAHGMAKTDPAKKILAITFEDHFLHSGMAALVNTVYNDSAFTLLVLTGSREREIETFVKGCGVSTIHRINTFSEIEHFHDSGKLTVLFGRGII